MCILHTADEFLSPSSVEMKKQVKIWKIEQKGDKYFQYLGPTHNLWKFS